MTALRDPLAGLDFGADALERSAQDALTLDYPGQPRDKNKRFATGKMNGGDYDKPTGFAKNSKGELTLDKSERKRYDNLLLGEKTSDGITVKSISQHAYDRAAQRRISPGEIREVLSAKSAPSSYDEKCMVYDGHGIRIVVNTQNGKMVSVMWRD